MDSELRAYLDRRETAIGVVRRILIDNLHFPVEPERIDLDVPLFGTGLGLDSVDALELVVAAEAAFAISLPDDRLREQLRTVNTLVDLVLECQQGAGGS